jgi:hypothetical protein
MNLSQKLLVIPTITTICEGGFFKLNDIKNHFLSCLKMDTFDALMHVSLWGIEVDNMDKRIIFHIWHNDKN